MRPGRRASPYEPGGAPTPVGAHVRSPATRPEALRAPCPRKAPVMDVDEFWAESGPVTGVGLVVAGRTQMGAGWAQQGLGGGGLGVVVEVAGHDDRSLLAVAVEECGDVGGDADCLFV